MKPPVFRYVAARSLEEAATALAAAGEDAKILAGGQSLGPMLNLRLAHPSALIDINHVPGLNDIRVEAGCVRIGAMVRHRGLETSALISAQLPIMSAAAKHVAHVTIRNRGTFGGSLAHADPAAEWPLLACLLNAEMSLHSTTGSRQLTADKFFVTTLTTALRADEILTDIRIPELAVGTGWGFEEMSRRLGDFALAAAAALVTVSAGKCKEARIALAGVGTTPLRAVGAEALLTGQVLTADALRAAGAKAATECAPPSDIHATAEFRRHLISVLTTRALTAAVERAT